MSTLMSLCTSMTFIGTLFCDLIVHYTIDCQIHEYIAVYYITWHDDTWRDKNIRILNNKLQRMDQHNSDTKIYN